MLPLPSTAGNSGVLLAGATTAVGADQVPPARLRATTMRPPFASSHHAATASPERPSAIVGLGSALTVAAEIAAGPCQAAACALSANAAAANSDMTASAAVLVARRRHMRSTLATTARQFNARPEDLPTMGRRRQVQEPGR